MVSPCLAMAEIMWCIIGLGHNLDQPENQIDVLRICGTRCSAAESADGVLLHFYPSSNSKLLHVCVQAMARLLLSSSVAAAFRSGLELCTAPLRCWRVCPRQPAVSAQSCVRACDPRESHRWWATWHQYSCRYGAVSPRGAAGHKAE